MSIASEHLLEIRELVKNHLAQHEDTRITPERAEELKAELAEGEKRVREELKEEMKRWKVENEKANVSFKDIVENK